MAEERESMEFDVVIVGAGPSGLSASIKLMQLSEQQGLDLNICVLEKSSDIGSHIISGAVVETHALDELLPDWEASDAFIRAPVTRDQMSFLINQTASIGVPSFLIPTAMNNHGNSIISLGSLCRWLASKAEALGVNIFPGFPAVDFLEEEGSVVGVVSGDMGLSREGQPKDGYEPGYELRAKYTVLSEGCRGNLGKKLIKRFKLDADSDPQHYGIGFKEIWAVDPEKHEEGLVLWIQELKAEDLSTMPRIINSIWASSFPWITKIHTSIPLVNSRNGNCIQKLIIFSRELNEFPMAQEL